MKYFEISPINVDNPGELLNPTPEMLERIIKVFSDFNKPFFHIRHAQITSKQLIDWTKVGLIPWDDEKGKWRQFSLIEIIWLKFVQELKFYGLPNRYILDLKREFFPTNVEEATLFYDNILMNDKLTPEFREKFEFYRGKMVDESEAVGKELKNINFSFFGMIVVSIILFNKNIGFFTNDEFATFVSFSKPLSKSEENMTNEIFQIATSKSFAIINIKYLVDEILKEDKVNLSDDYFLTLLKDFERDIILKIRSGEYKQIEIKLEAGNATQLRLSRKNNDDLLNKISRMFKSGDYTEVNLTTRDGKIVKCDIKDIEKIQNNN